jgi:hypothetical protein
MALYPPDQPVTVLCEINDSQEDNTSTVVEDDLLDGGYGWVCVAACFTSNAVTWGAVSVSQCFSYLDLGCL